MTDMQPSLGSRIMVAVGKVAAYLALFLGCQTLLVSIFTAVITAQLMGEGIMDQDQLLQQVYPRVLDSSTLLTLFSGLLTIVILVIVYLIRRRPLQDAFWLHKVPARTLLAGPCMVPALYLAVTMFLMILPQSLLSEYEQASASLSADVGVVSFLSVVLVSPVVEELVFRGLIMTRLTTVAPPIGAVILSAAIFGFCHGEFVWFCYAFLLGMVFGLMDMRAGSILPSIAAHIAFNLVGQIFSMCSVLLPEGTYEGILMTALVAFALFLPMFNRKAVSAVFMGPVNLPEAAAKQSAVPMSQMAAPQYRPQYAPEGQTYGSRFGQPSQQPYTPQPPQQRSQQPYTPMYQPQQAQQQSQLPQQQAQPTQWSAGDGTVTWENTEYVVDPWN